MKLHKNNEALKEFIQATSINLGIPEEYVEKDYFVSLLLKNISLEHPNILFKGGTSLSKCYGIINRFSEDIDINIKLENKATEKEKRELKNSIIKAIDNSGMTLENRENIFTRRNFNQYEVTYNSNSEIGDILRPHLLVETYLTIRSFPFESKEVNNYIYQFLKQQDEIDLIKQFELEPYLINVQSLDRTFIDKIFAICDYHEKCSYTQNSRHFYDIHRIWSNYSFEPESFTRLFYDVAIERRKNPNVNHSCASGYNIVEKLHHILKNNHFEKDYQDNTIHLLFDEVDYNTVKSTLISILDSGLIPFIIE